MTSSDQIIVGSYDDSVAALSILIAVLTSFSALELAKRLAAASGRIRLAWMVGGAATQSVGIWSMHYVGMLSFRLPVPVQYAWPTVLLSFVYALLAAVLSLFVVSRRQIRARQIVLSGVFMGFGIVALHYTGMASMRFAGSCRYSPGLVTLSVIFAIGFALLSFRLTFLDRQWAGGSQLQRPGAALLMGAAISAMHFTAMAAATFVHADTPPDLSHAITISLLGIAGIGTATVAVLGITVLTSIVDRFREQRILLQRSFEQLRALNARLQIAREHERARVAREIHDELGQVLTGIKLDTSSLIHDLAAGRPAQPLTADQQEQLKRAESVGKQVDEAIRSVRRIATELRPALLDDLGLVAAIEWAADEFRVRTGITCQIRLPEVDITVDQEHAIAVFRILQETLTNVARHAKATELSIRLARLDGKTLLEVHDNGIGFEPESLPASSSLGILGMRERAWLLSGELRISSRVGKGTTVRVEIPDGPEGVPGSSND